MMVSAFSRTRSQDREPMLLFVRMRPSPQVSRFRLANGLRSPGSWSSLSAFSSCALPFLLLALIADDFARDMLGFSGDAVLETLGFSHDCRSWDPPRKRTTPASMGAEHWGRIPHRELPTRQGSTPEARLLRADVSIVPKFVPGTEPIGTKLAMKDWSTS
jgi:hypothetical protein